MAITGLIRDDKRRSVTLPETVLLAGDTLFLRGEPDALERMVSKTGLVLARQDSPVPAQGARTR